MTSLSMNMIENLRVEPSTSSRNRAHAVTHTSGVVNTPTCKCVCGICTCGRHHCPTNGEQAPDQAHYENLQSHYRSDYPRHAPNLVRARPPPGSVLPTAGETFAGESIAKSDFVAFPDAKPAPLLRPKYQHVVGGDENRHFVSEKQQQYTPKRLDQPTVSCAPPAWTLTPDDRDWKTENNDRLKKHPNSVRESYKPVKSTIESSPFAGESTSSAHYKPHQTARTAPILPMKERGFGDDDDRDFLTEHGAHYTEKRVEPCPAIALPDSKRKSANGHILYEKAPPTHDWTRRPSAQVGYRS